MHYRLFVNMITVCVLYAACSPSKQAGKTKHSTVISTGIQADSISYYDDRYTVTRVVDQKELKGRWDVETMHRQPDSVPEKLNGVTLSFADSSFAGNAPCNSIAGDLIVQGTGIGFENIVKTEMPCDKMNQEIAFIGLLKKNVRSAVLEGDRLLLRDSKGYIVFECRKDR